MFSQGYLIDSQVCIAALWFFYIVILHRRTNLRAARWFLLSLVPVGLMLPLIQIPLLPAPSVTSVDREVIYIVEEGFTSETTVEAPVADPTLPVAGWIYLLGVITVGTILAARIVPTWLAAKRATRRASDLVVYTSKSPGAYSAFGVIFLNPKYEGSPMVDQIIAHEQSHISHRHTLDIVWMGLWQTLLWFHPAVWHTTKLLREVHEFQADRDVIRQGHSVAPYIELLIGTEAGIYPGAAQAFCYSLTKKRLQLIAQATRKTNIGGYIRLAALVPMIGLLLGAFSLTTRAAETQPFNNSAPTATDALPRISYSKVMGDSKILPQLVPMRTDSHLRYETLLIQGQPPAYGGQRIDQDAMATSERSDLTEAQAFVTELAIEISPTIQQNVPAEDHARPEIPLSQSAPNIAVVRRHETTDSIQSPIYVVDGVIYTSKEFQEKRIKAENYQSITVLKGETAIAKYGEQGRNGVIIITTKQTKLTSQAHSNPLSYYLSDETTALSKRAPMHQNFNNRFDSLRVAIVNIGQNVRKEFVQQSSSENHQGNIGGIQSPSDEEKEFKHQSEALYTEFERLQKLLPDNQPLILGKDIVQHQRNLNGSLHNSEYNVRRIRYYTPTAAAIEKGDTQTQFDRTISIKLSEKDKQEGITADKKLLQEYPEIFIQGEDGKIKTTCRIFISILEEI